ncbi:MAG: AtpZ/AtpI family protein [Lentisphaeria bacterium]|nr:AtpZ/AtpI family protein [Lentisphaeria bacterium]NQZ66638.1 AtpZ/AtpI family protein [Lentisphaeria bacterium]
MSEDKKPEDNSSRRSVNDAMTLGISFAVAFIGFTFLGVWLDEKFQTNFLFTLAGVCLAFVFVIYEIWKICQKTLEDEKKENDNDKTD